MGICEIAADVRWDHKYILGITRVKREYGVNERFRRIQTYSTKKDAIAISRWLKMTIHFKTTSIFKWHVWPNK